MKNTNKKQSQMKSISRMVLIASLLMFLPHLSVFEACGFATLQAQNTVTIKGVVKDVTGETLIGANVIVEGAGRGTVTDFDGNFSLVVNKGEVVEISYVGFLPQKFKITESKSLFITLKDDSETLDEVVVVGYGVQKKESVVGAIAQVKGEKLMQSGGVTNVSEALQGKLPGVVSMYTTGQPGATDEAQIYIRGQSSWNSSGSPLVLVDGVERSMNDLDMNEVESISVLKDASATAVYGVKGANGVILITTKRGQKGEAKLSVSGNVTLKTISKVPEKYDAYDAMMIMNSSVMNELMYKEGSWGYITPLAIANLYRNQTTQEQMEMYPNVDWEDYMFKDVATDYRVNLSASGGSDFAKYFCNISYLNESDMTKEFDNNKGYQSSMSYQRFNYRSNLDFNITKTTQISANISGLYSIQHQPQATGSSDASQRMFLSLYNLAPDLYYPRYSNGAYGFSDITDMNLSNSLLWYTSYGLKKSYNFRINADITLKQELDFITKGLSLQGRFTMDNLMTGSQLLTDVTDGRPNVLQQHYNSDGSISYGDMPISNPDYAYVPEMWKQAAFNVGGNKVRRVDYQLGLHYNRTFDSDHNTSALFLFKRQQYASGNMFPMYYEDWVARITYDYATRYFIEANGAYNGSEKFSSDYRFELFPSIAGGWMISNESFMESTTSWLDKLKVRFSYGLVGDDNFTTERWLYMSQWAALDYKVPINSDYFGGTDVALSQSPYSLYEEALLGNNEIHWETSTKQDIGLEFSFLNGSIAGEVDYFSEKRRDIYIPGDERTISDIFGIEPPGSNIGAVDLHGYEVVLNLRHNFDHDFRIWSDLSYTYAKDVVVFKDDPEYTPDYMKEEGFSIGQSHTAIQGDMMENWDDVYASLPLTNGDSFKRVGYYDLVDYNGDGIYDSTTDNVAYQYPNRPQGTWSANVGAQYKSFSLSVQFYGQFNSTRSYTLQSFPHETHLYFKDNGDYWTPDNTDAQYTLAPVTLDEASSDPYRNLVDATITRLKMVELSYNLPTAFCKQMGVEGLRLFVNGNNLYLWTDMADDRDFGSGAAYPTLKRFNIGLNLDL